MKSTALAVVSRSPLVIEGLKAIVSDIPEVDIDFNELEVAEIDEWLSKQSRAVVLFDPTYSSAVFWENIMDSYGKTAKFIALAVLPLSEGMQKKVDASISLFDSRKSIEATLRKYIFTVPSDDYPELTLRERDIVIGIAKGLTNKEIAEELHVSVNTVMTHRRNIASKLEIHSPAGLTIYAIVTKLVDITEVQMS